MNRGPSAFVLTIVLIVGVVAVPTPAPAQSKATPVEKETGGNVVFQKVIKSTVWILSKAESGAGYSTGTGSLIDVSERLVVTNYHVVRERDAVTVMFPVFEKGQLWPIPERKKNIDLLNSGAGITGKVIARESKKDLAIIKLDKLPPGGAPALRLAKDSVRPGETLHSIGNPGASGALWVYTDGKVKAVYDHRFTTGTKSGKEAPFQIEARVVETTSAVNPGDSGGPVVNNNCELVAVTQGHISEDVARSISYFIDISEVKNVLKTKGFARVAAAASRPAPAETSSASAEPKISATSDTAADDAERMEKAAAAKLDLVKALVRDGKKDKARERLDEIVKTYPKTKAAEEAKDLLQKLK